MTKENVGNTKRIRILSVLTNPLTINSLLPTKYTEIASFILSLMNKSIIFIDAMPIKLQLTVPRRLTTVTMSPIEPVDSNHIPHYITIVTRDT